MTSTNPKEQLLKRAEAEDTTITDSTPAISDGTVPTISEVTGPAISDSAVPAISDGTVPAISDATVPTMEAVVNGDDTMGQVADNASVPVAENTENMQVDTEEKVITQAPSSTEVSDPAPMIDATKAALDANAVALQHHQAVVAAAAAHHAATMQMLATSQGVAANPMLASMAVNPDIDPSTPSGKKMVNHYYIDFSLTNQSDVEGDAPLKGEPIGHILAQGLAAQMSGNSAPAPSESALVNLPIEKKGREIRTFPMKLHEILGRGEVNHIISWLPHGRSFLVHNPDQLVIEVLPKYLKPIKYTSFTRQLQLWGFKRITKAPDHGAYYHQLFLRGKPHLLKRMHVTKVKGSGKKLTSNPQQEPDFYSLSRLRPLPDAGHTALPNAAGMIAAGADTAASAAMKQHAAAAAGLFAGTPYMQQAQMFLQAHHAHPGAGFPYLPNPMMAAMHAAGAVDPQTQIAQMLLAQQASAAAAAAMSTTIKKEEEKIPEKTQESGVQEQVDEQEKANETKLEIKEEETNPVEEATGENVDPPVVDAAEVDEDKVKDPTANDETMVVV